MNTIDYRSLVYLFQYVTFTSPNIQHAINRACQFFQSPTKLHLKAVKRILRYLKSTMAFSSYHKVIKNFSISQMQIGQDV